MNQEQNNTAKHAYTAIWTERVIESDGFGDEIDKTHYVRNLVIHADSANQAQEIWDRENANEGTNGLTDLYRHIDHPLAKSFIRVELSDTQHFAVRVHSILREHAQKHVYRDPSKSEDDVSDYILTDSIPLFENDTNALIAWAQENTNWDSLVDDRAVLQLKTPQPVVISKDEYWKTGTHTFVDEIK